MATAKLELVAIDCPDPTALARRPLRLSRPQGNGEEANYMNDASRHRKGTLGR
ncbi:hypothetical protein [Streptomyces antioxidans]|uniref:hypothetical protein n=1 Tax=Streptomyces TaxID=1883 RepID=UPI000A969F3C|nr:hypothetical protein [Streptomyces antioxidans]